MAQIVLNVTLNSEAAKEQIEAIKTSFTTLAESLNKIQPNKELTAQLKALASAYKGMAASVKATTDAEKEEHKTRRQELRTTQEKYRADGHLYKAIKEKQKANEAYLGVEKEGLKIQGKLIKTQGKSTEQQKKHNKATEKGTKANQNFFETVSQMARGFMQWQIAATLVMKPIYAIRNGIKSLNDTLVETEKTIVALRRVLPENNFSNTEMANKLYDLAIQYGQTFENVSEIATNFARTGMDFNDTIKATNAALLALNVAELDATEASDGLIAVLSQFGLKAADLELVVDKINKVADRFPVTTSKMMAALQRTGAAAVNANMSLDRTLGIITALSKATGRGGQNIGTALNSLIQYSTKAKALETFSNLSDDVAKVVEQFKVGAADILDIWTAVSNELDHLSDTQKDLLDAYFKTDEGQKLEEELSAELGDIYNDISAVYGTANTFRKNYFIALLKNIDTAQQAAQTAATAAGYSQKENAAEMETYARRLEALKEQWKKLANDEQGILKFKKGLLGIGEAMLTIIEWTGGLKTTIMTLIPLMIAAFGPPMLLAIKKMAVALKAAGIAASTFSKTMLVISAVVLVISAAIGVSQRFKEKQEEARRATIEAWDNEKDRLWQLIDAYNVLRGLTDDDAEGHKKANEKIVPLLDERHQKMLSLIEDQEKYNELVGQFAQEETEDAAEKARAAADAKYEEWEKGLKKRKGVRAVFHQILDYPLAGDTDKRTQTGLIQELGKKYPWLAKMYNPGVSKEDQEAAELAYWSMSFDQFYEFWEAVKQYLLSIPDTSRDPQENSLLVYIENYLMGYWDEIVSNKRELEDAISAEADAAKTKLKAEGKEPTKEWAQKLYNDLLQKFLPGLTAGSFPLTPGSPYAMIEEIIRTYSFGQLPGENPADPVNKVTDATKKWADALKEVNAQLKSAKSELDAQRKTAEKLLAIKEAETRLYEAQAKLAEAIRNARKDYVLGVLNDYLKGEETAATLEEKQNALIKARQELLEAQNSERTVRLWNQRAQIWEWQTRPDEEKIKTAEDNVEKAVKDLNEYLKDVAVSELKDAIENGTATADNIYGILEKWLSKGEGEGLGEWGADLSEKISAAIRSGQYDPSKVTSAQQAVINAKQAVINAQMSLKDYYTEAMWNEVLRLTSEGGAKNAAQIWNLVNTWAAKGASAEDVKAIKDVLASLGFKEPIPYVHSGLGGVTHLHDTGGILRGTGNIKATADDEIVLPPHIASKIVEPQSNAQFHNFVRDLGLLFGVTKRSAPAQTPVYNNTSSVSDSHNSYVVNGVPISAAAAQKFTIAELFQNMELLPV